jgi:hypothetical protein
VKAGEKTFIREVEGGTGTSCQNSLTCHFGLGAHNGEVTVTVRWICGKERSFTARSDRLLHFKEGGEKPRVLMGEKVVAEEKTPEETVAPDVAPQPQPLQPALVAPLKDFGAALRDFAEADVRGAVVIAVLENAAARAGIEAGEIIVKFNGTEVSRVAQFEQLRARLGNGQPAVLEVFRNGKPLTIKLNEDEK